jgi:hypothetical protein
MNLPSLEEQSPLLSPKFKADFILELLFLFSQAPEQQDIIS